MAEKQVKTPTPISIATEQMGRGWDIELAKRVNKSRTYVREAVRYQRLDAPIWDAVEELKREREALLKKNANKIKKLFQQQTQNESQTA